MCEIIKKILTIVNIPNKGHKFDFAEISKEQNFPKKNNQGNDSYKKNA